MSQRNATLRVENPSVADAHVAESGMLLYRLAGRLCGGEWVTEAVTTQFRVSASPESMWDRILFYEEVPGRPPFPLGTLLPLPIRTEGEKTSVGATVRCVYSGGLGLTKRIVAVDPASLLQFEVVEQSLGIEDCLVTVGGSYQIENSGGSTCVALKTNYRARLHPRWFWRPVEAFLVRQLHKHILRGLSAALRAENRVLSPEALAMPRERAGGLACTAQSRSRR